ncbi:hypothetical protein FB45DRAFT_1004742 [Roridomyces roridus]|uniref:Uncharacterized protein n=1 Tax=Roridomyces roridus TaxID=1738132 RepID=A0AAD7FLR3_9AGAR|nr:hypothetical protein FB45DRAFT_1004742 [Roridomyces roridus]
MALHTLLCCCLGSAHIEDVDDASRVIPDERSHLIPKDTLPSQRIRNPLTVDHQKRMTAIVRVKQGKMVNLNARTPFTMKCVHTPSAYDSNEPPIHHRRCSVMTMTPARGSGNPSRTSSPVTSRSSSPGPGPRPTYQESPIFTVGAERGSTLKGVQIVSEDERPSALSEEEGDALRGMQQLSQGLSREAIPISSPRTRAFETEEERITFSWTED